MVEALQALRGVQFTVALSTVAELGDLSRFDSPRQLMSYLGLTPSEYSTGNTRRLGGITKAGNAHARRTLIEGAWAYRYNAKVSRQMQQRQETLPQAIRDTAWKAQVSRVIQFSPVVVIENSPPSVQDLSFFLDLLLIVGAVEVVGERPESVGSLWATRMLSIGCPHGPKGSGRSAGLVHKSIARSSYAIATGSSVRMSPALSFSLSR